MATVSLSNYELVEEDGTLGDMDSGKDDGDTINAGEVGEIAVVELGAPGKGVYSEYEILALGGVPDDQLRTADARVEGDLQNASAADVASGTRIRFRLTNKRGHNKTYAETGWFKKKNIEASSVENLPVLEYKGYDHPSTEWIGEGRVIVVEAWNPSSAFNIDTSNSSTEFPFVGGF